MAKVTVTTVISGVLWFLLLPTWMVMKFLSDLDILHPSMVRCPVCRK